MVTSIFQKPDKMEQILLHFICVLLLVVPGKLHNRLVTNVPVILY